VKREAAASGVATGANSGNDGEVWLPMEMDTTLLDHKWFWGPNTDHMIKPLGKLMKIYLTSVGRGGVLLLNATPDTSGLIPESHLARYREFGAAIQRLYANKKGETSGEGTDFELRFDVPTAVTHVVIQEDIHRGHAVRKYDIRAEIDGKWRRLAEGEPIGYKRIVMLDKVEVTALRLRITETATTPYITSFSAYETDDIAAADSDANTNEWIRIAAWDNITPSTDWQTVEVDLTPAIQQPGEYRVEIRKTEGDATLESADAMLLIAGVDAARHITPLEQPNTWRIQRTDQVTNDDKGRTSLRIKTRLTNGSNWQGEMRVRQ
jgi:alpha-L-fucosidase